MRMIEAFPRITGWLAGRSIARAFAKGEEGSVAVEMGFATVVFTTMLTGLISFGSLFFIQGSMTDAARDAARRVATGELTTTQAETYAQGNLINWGMTYLVTATIEGGGTEAKVEISVPMSDAALIDMLGLFSGNLSASMTMPVES